MAIGRGFALFWFSLLSMAIPLCGQMANYDGHWWLSVDERNREGFVDGFVVCYYNLVDSKVFKESSLAYSIRTTNYIKDNPESLTKSSGALLLEMAKPPYAKPVHRPAVPNEAPNEIKAKWGANNDGFEWRGPDSWNLGYVEGFLDCYSNYTKHHYGTLSKSPQWYVDAIANWYGTKPGDPDALNLSREKDKIPDVLFKFRDHEKGSSK